MLVTLPTSMLLTLPTTQPTILLLTLTTTLTSTLTTTLTSLTNTLPPRSMYVDRTLEFVAKFACSFLEKEQEADGREEEKDGEKEEELPLFLYRLFAWLLDHHEVRPG